MKNKILKSSTATYQSGVAKADGKLYVTQGEVRFEPYNESAGLGPYTLTRSAIVKIEKIGRYRCWHFTTNKRCNNNHHRK